jgi:hypothetical protein
MEINPPVRRTRDTLLLLFALLSLLVLVGRSIYVVVTGYMVAASNAEFSASTYGALSTFFIAALLLPMIILTVRHLKGQAIRSAAILPVKVWQIIVILAGWIISIIAASLLSGWQDFGWAIAIPFFLLGMTLPIIGLLWIAVGGIETGSWRRLWGTLGLSMTLSTLLALVMELITVVIAVGLVIFVAVLDPSLRLAFEQLVNQVQDTTNIEALLPLLTPYLDNPVLLISVLLFASVFAPLIEELMKPLAVWLVGKRLRSPAEGFALGAICGAGFTLWEGLLAASGAPTMLGFTMAGRATSSLMHITVSGLMGWGIASAILQKRYGRLAGIYALAVAIHGLWNGAVLLTVYGSLKLTLQGVQQLDMVAGALTAIGLGILGLMLISILVLLPIINYRLRKKTAPPNDIIAVQ